MKTLKKAHMAYFHAFRVDSGFLPHDMYGHLLHVKVSSGLSDIVDIVATIKKMKVTVLWHYSAIILKYGRVGQNFGHADTRVPCLCNYVAM